MKSLMISIVVLVVMSIASCGGGGATIPNPNPNPNPNPAPQDNTAPDVQINGIEEGERYGEQVAGANLLFVRGIAADASGVTNSSMRVNGNLVAAANDSEVNFTWDVTEYTDGSYEVEVRAADANGNIGTSTMTVVVDNDLFAVIPGLFPLIPEIEIIPGWQLIPGL